MSYAVSERVTVTTDASGDATVYTAARHTGMINCVIFTDTDLDNTADFTITTEDTAQNVWVESNVTTTKTVAPRQATHDTVGVASLYAAGGEPVETGIYCCNERIKFVVAQGGNTKTGTFRVVIT